MIIKKFGCGRTTFYRILRRNKTKIFPKGYFHKGKIAWNKGLTKEDVIVKKYHEKGVQTRLKNRSYKANSGSFKKGYKINLGRCWKNPKLSEKRKEMFKENKLKRMFGKENPAWKGGIYKLSRQIRFSRKYKEWRKKVVERDNYTCQKCGKKKELHAHHKIPFIKIIRKFNIKNTKEANNCKELWEISNGQTLCKDCHPNNNI